MVTSLAKMVYGRGNLLPLDQKMCNQYNVAIGRFHRSLSQKENQLMCKIFYEALKPDQKHITGDRRQLEPGNLCVFQSVLLAAQEEHKPSCISI